jgi:serine/threonine-protein kinase
MSPDPPPLPAGRVLADRFEVQRLLGRGGFGIAYLARDRARGDQVVVKELAPVGMPRDATGLIDLGRSGTPGHVLRHRFLQEAEVLRVIHHPGVPALRAAFAENGTAYHVTTYLPGAQTLDDRLRHRGRLTEGDAREIFISLLDVLERVHDLGVLHRDVKPSNVLLGPNGEVLLIDFGAARDWVGDSALTHTVMHTPGYAPPEQLSEKAPRGPATDLYALCATAYHMLAGQPPPTANDRLAGIELTPLVGFRPDLEPAFARAIEAGLSIKPADRPASVEQLRTLLSADGPATNEPLTLERVIETIQRLRGFRFEKRACPACQGVLIEPRPIRRGGCPVCVQGALRKRTFDELRCPVCRSGRLDTLDNSGPLSICPLCAKGRLAVRRRGILSREREAECDGCGAHFELSASGMEHKKELATYSEWRQRSGRSALVRACNACEFQLDEMPDGRWRQRWPATPQSRSYYSDEWARIAANLPPGAGNTGCDACGADFWQEDERLTLLDAPADPQGYAAAYLGRALHVEDVRWLAVGKESGEPGLVCEECATEFDRDGEYYRLVRSPSRRLCRHLGEPRTLEDWHRIGQDLPTVDAEEAYLSQIGPLLRQAYRTGSLSFDDSGTAWRGEATRLSDGVASTLTISPSEISFGGLFRRWRAPLDAVLHVEASESELILTLSGHAAPESFALEPVTLTAHLPSGDHELVVTAEDLAVRMSGGGLGGARREA